MTATSQTKLPMEQLRSILTTACHAVGCNDGNAASLVEATLSAHLLGPPAMGLPHFVDYLEAFKGGRIDGRVTPQVTRPLPAIISVDAKKGIAQAGFDLVFSSLVEQTRKTGLALFTQSNSYTAGELGYYVRRLAAEGFVALAATNGPPLMAVASGGQRVYCTNPLAFAAPGGPLGGQIVIDQASSATAFVKLIKAAAAGEAIPEGWAIDASGAPTTDAAAAVAGALLPFGGARGANIALMVELLAAGLSGANWSLDAGDFRSSDQSPAIGLTIIVLAPPPGFAARAAAQAQRLASLGVHIPGLRSANRLLHDEETTSVDAEALATIQAITAAAGRQTNFSNQRSARS
ncbi:MULTISPECIES: Ldh family oxidoreductase [Mesorhizobium]|uniref:Malate dehydrogenase n=1 Tax=Mesorhizobium denitrificans TaxID=2294114 RepID=A0A371XCN8_9HYPH|nr:MULTISPECIES: Ldh family oxidoreductase [Mesorhizobium]RFC66982.1 malate dehydrogenase [Mesorhizobium denitrificans]